MGIYNTNTRNERKYIIYQKKYEPVMKQQHEKWLKLKKNYKN
jgi:hypothetical protein